METTQRYRVRKLLDAWPVDGEPGVIHLLVSGTHWKAVKYDHREYTENPWMARLLCPCGCGRYLKLFLADPEICTEPPGPYRILKLGTQGEHIIQMPQFYFLRPDRGGATLHPAVRLRTGCRSRFKITQGVVEWL